MHILKCSKCLASPVASRVSASAVCGKPLAQAASSQLAAKGLWAKELAACAARARLPQQAARGEPGRLRTPSLLLRLQAAKECASALAAHWERRVGKTPRSLSLLLAQQASWVWRESNPRPYGS